MRKDGSEETEGSEGTEGSEASSPGRNKGRRIDISCEDVDSGRGGAAIKNTEVD